MFYIFLLPALTLVIIGLFLIKLFLLFNGRPGPFFSDYGSSRLFLLLRDAEIVIQSKLNSMVAILSWLYPGVANLVGLLMYAEPTLSLDSCSLGHELIHAG